MNRKELAQTISASTRVDARSVLKILNAVAAHLQAELANGESATLPGFGKFIRRKPRQEGKPGPIIFRPAPPKEDREARSKHKGGGGSED
jgi:hypothetical protein